MSIADNSSGKNYWIVTIQTTHVKAGVAGGDLVTSSLASVPVQGTGIFKPGRTLQYYARKGAEASSEELESQYNILSVVASSRDDIEGYRAEFGDGQPILDFDGKSSSRFADVGAEL